MAQLDTPQIDFSVIADAFKKRYPDMDLPEFGQPQNPGAPTATQFAQETAQGQMATVPEGQPQEINSIGGAKSEAQKIVEVLASRLKKLPWSATGAKQLKATAGRWSDAMESL